MIKFSTKLYAKKNLGRNGVIELAQQVQKLTLLLIRQRREQLGNQRFLLRHDQLEQCTPAIG